MAMEGSQALFNRVIALKLINKESRAAVRVRPSDAGGEDGQRKVSSTKGDSGRLGCIDCIKVSFAVGSAADVLTGSESRIPLQLHEWSEVLRALTTTEHLFGALKTHRLAVLAK